MNQEMAIKIGFIGVGGIAQHHMNHLKNIPNAKMVAFYDVNQEATAQVAEKYGAQAMDSVDAVLDKTKIDAVYICTPQFARGDLEIEAVKRGIPFFVEKPLGVELEPVQTKAKIIRESGIVHSVGYVLRYYDTVQEAKKYLEGKKMFLVQATRMGGAHGSKWWTQMGMSGGNLVDAGTHQVDTLRYIAGEYQNVYANFSSNEVHRLDPDATIYSGGALSFTMKSGAVGTMMESCITKYNGGSQVKIFGPDFALELSSNGKQLTIMDETGTTTRVSETIAATEQCLAFLKAVETGDRSAILSNYDEGLKTLEFTLEANRSAIVKQPIELS